MSIKTKSAFYYGHVIDDENYAVDFKEGATTYLADMPVGNYTLTQFGVALESLLNNIGTYVYTVSIDRVTRLITISAPTDFELLISSGRPISLYPLIGFSGADRSGASLYVGNNPSGSAWYPQDVARKYVPKEHNKQKISPVINETANGDIESISFGNRRFIEADFMHINNLQEASLSNIDDDSQGIENALAFIDNVIEKVKFEFIPDKDTTSTYSEVLLESIAGSSSGTGFKLKKMFGESGKAYYQMGLMKMRVV